MTRKQYIIIAALFLGAACGWFYEYVVLGRSLFLFSSMATLALANLHSAWCAK
jgi:hypothetical protein